MIQLTPKSSREDWRAQMTPKPRSRASIHHQVGPQMTPKVLMAGGSTLPQGTLPQGRSTQLTPKCHRMGPQLAPKGHHNLCKGWSQLAPNSQPYTFGSRIQLAPKSMAAQSRDPM